MGFEKDGSSAVSISVWIKSEPFTFGTLAGTPHHRLGFSNIRKMVAYCKSKGAQGYPSVQYSIWKHIACNKLQLSEEYAWMYFEQYHMLAGELSSSERLEMFHLNAHSEKSPVRLRLSANTLQFVLFLYIQQIHKISMKSSLVTGDEWPSHARSPDLETARTTTNGKNLDENSHFTFVNNHLHDILELLIDSPGESAVSDINISGEVVKALSFFLGVTQPGQRRILPVHEVAASPEFAAKTGYVKATNTFGFKKLHSWLRANLGLSPYGISACIANGKRLSWLPVEQNPSSKRLGKIGTNAHLVQKENIKGNKILIMTQVGKQMVARSSGTLENAYVKIHRCQYSYFYLLSPLRSVSIEKCKNTIVVLGPVEVAVLMSGCENVQVIAPCGRMVVSNSILCTLVLLTPCKPLILPGNEGITLAPYNTFYPMLEEHMKRTVLPASINLWDQPLLAGHDHHADSASVWSLMSPSEFHKFVIPFEMEGSTAGIPCPLPATYKKALDEKLRDYREWQKSVTEAGLSEEKRLVFGALVDQRFQDWLTETGHKKEVETIGQQLDAKAKYSEPRK